MCDICNNEPCTCQGQVQEQHDQQVEQDVSAQIDCPLQEVKLVELVEIVTRGAAEAPVSGISQNPTEKTPLQEANATVARPPTNPARQYINLPRDLEGAEREQPNYGRYIELRARIEWKDSSRTESLAGHTVHFSYTITNGTGRPAQIYDGAKEGFGSQTTTTAQTDAKGWTSVIKFKLSMYGGDKFKIAAQADENGDGNPEGTKLETGDYEVWRKVSYQFDAMISIDGKNYSFARDTVKFENELKRHSIEMNKLAMTQPANRRAIANEKKDEWVNANFLNHGEDRSLYIALVDTVGGSPRQEKTSEFGPKAGNAEFKFDILNEVIDISNKDLWFKSAEYYDEGSPANKTAIDKSKAELTVNGHDYKLELDLTGLDRQKNYKVKLTYYSYGAVSGLAWGSNVLVDMRHRYKFNLTINPSTLNAVLHETGHYLGLAAKKLPNKAGNNYTDYYFQSGNHCKYNTDGCVMYHTGTEITEYCNNCGNALRARNLSNPPVSGADDF